MATVVLFSPPDGLLRLDFVYLMAMLMDEKSLGESNSHDHTKQEN